MAGIEITVGKDLLPGLLSGQDGLAKLVESVLNQVLEAQVTEMLGAERHERTGDRQLAVRPEGTKRPGVGRQNIDMALQVLKRGGLSPVVSDLGGCRGRKIFFKTDTGEVFLKRLRCLSRPSE